MVNSLTGRFVILTIIFVMLAEVLIFLPSVARFRLDYLQNRLELGQIASLSLLATDDDMVDPDLERELLANAEVLNIVLRREAMRLLVLSSPMPEPVAQTYDLREAGFFELIGDALMTMFRSEDRVIRVIGMPVKSGGTMIEASLYERPLRQAMIAYGFNILRLSLFISVLTALLLVIVVRFILVRPIKRVVQNMMRYRDNPEDARRIMEPKSRVSELRQAEETLADLQTQLTGSLRQKERLAGVGGAVSRISHDLRNILTTAHLLVDRFERSEDPTVKRTAPKLVSSLDRAINLCESTLAFGKAEEPAPKISRLLLAPVVADVIESDQLREIEGGVAFETDIPEDLQVHADGEQLYRVFSNLIRNARQAIEESRESGSIRVRASNGGDGCIILVSDTGPGLPKKAMEHLFQPFQGGVRRGGTGLGLAIAAELIKGHGGRLDLVRTSAEGTEFRIFLPVPDPAAA
ncbi:sensor histidine kinase [Algicella marina]|uniref:histidine kinase n=1 Tax=Algicella marina TaxID=2683284 RepID=A0A6P1T6G2_9RHOB|nr:HAMP domain-containing sensor histidine kinase [Algicella marina]QHQ37401.1 sensor histidine kinase [Algicella marina]